MERKWKKALMVEGDAWGYAIAEGRKDRCEARVRVKETVGARQIGRRKSEGERSDCGGSEWH